MAFGTVKVDTLTSSTQTTQPLGDCRKVTATDPSDLQPTETLSTNVNEPTSLTTMKTFLSVFAAYVAAGAFGVAFVQTAMVEPLQHHSGTQSYVRVVR